jgi:transcriptional regulator with XRE-family HTH domain
VRFVNHEQLVTVLTKAKGELSLRQFAQKIGFSAAYLSDIFNGRRQAGRELLREFGLTKTVTVTVDYHRLEKK